MTPGLIWDASFLFIAEGLEAVAPDGITFLRFVIGFATLSCVLGARRAVHASDRLGQAVVEGVFRTLKDPLRLALRPQYHWTDQKLHVHAWLCVVAYVLATLVHLRAVRDAGYAGSVDALFDDLATIRRVTVARPTARGRTRCTHQLETLSPLHARLIDALGIPT